ncbi:MAG: hypothetical protein Fur0022_01890 [Anaerolineales bacterium]
MNAPASEKTPLTRLALLATLGDLHREPLPYDLHCLRALVATLHPDLLCAEVTQEAWEQGDLTNAAVEVRAALAPAAALTDVVLIPIAPSLEQFSDFAPLPGWRRSLVRQYERLLRWGQRKAGHPEAIHGLAFEAFCHTVCLLTERTWDPQARARWESQNRALVENILQTIRQDPGGRVLVAAQCQRLHRLLPMLQAYPDLLQIVDYRAL